MMYLVHWFVKLFSCLVHMSKNRNLIIVLAVQRRLVHWWNGIVYSYCQYNKLCVFSCMHAVPICDDVICLRWRFEFCEWWIGRSLCCLMFVSKSHAICVLSRKYRVFCQCSRLAYTPTHFVLHVFSFVPCSLFHIHFVHSLIHSFVPSIVHSILLFTLQNAFSLICLSKAKQIRFRPKIFIWGLMTKQSKHFLFIPSLIPLWTKHSSNFLLP